MNLDGVKILIVDDEPDIREFITYNLAKLGATIDIAEDGKEALDKVESFRPDLLLLDIMMPEMDGVEVCRVLRTKEEYNHIAIAFLTARSEDYSHVAALDTGGDDYITKPIRPKVLVSRIQALLRRLNRIPNNTGTSNRLELGDLVIDSERVQVIRAGKDISLAKKEFELLHLLASRPGKVFRREEIFTKVWGTDVIVTNRTIDVHIRKIREKIGQDYIRTIKGIGYKFEF